MTLDIRRFASELRDAERSATALPLITEQAAGITWDQARAIARARDALRVEDGDTLIGYKLGWTSAAMRAAFGIERPNWGTLWESQVSSGDLDLRNLIHPKLEPELVFHAGTDLQGEVDAATVAGSQGLWALGLEVVDPRWPSFIFDFLDNTADNSSAARVAVGEVASVANPGDVTVDFGDGTTDRSGQGRGAMGDPFEAVAWLVRSLAAEGTHLRVGDIVFTGGLTPPLDVAPGVTYSLRAEAFDTIELRTQTPEAGDRPAQER